MGYRPSSRIGLVGPLLGPPSARALGGGGGGEAAAAALRLGYGPWPGRGATRAQRVTRAEAAAEGGVGWGHAAQHSGLPSRGSGGRGRWTSTRGSRRLGIAAVRILQLRNQSRTTRMARTVPTRGPATRRERKAEGRLRSGGTGPVCLRQVPCRRHLCRLCMCGTGGGCQCSASGGDSGAPDARISLRQRRRPSARMALQSAIWTRAA